MDKDFTELLVEAELEEARPIMISKDQAMGDEPFDMLQTSRDNIAAEEEEARQAEEKRKLDELRAQAEVKIDAIDKALEGKEGAEYGSEYSNQLEAYFDELVPSSGIADTVAGEIVRAMMRLIYRYWNDGDLFYRGYGLETCGGSAYYIAEMVPDTKQDFFNIVSEELDNSQYERALENIAGKVIHFLRDHYELMATPNEEDSRGYDTEDYNWKEMAPKYDLEIPVPDNVMDFVDEGMASMYDIYSYVEDLLSEELGSEVMDHMDRPSHGYLNFSELTADQYDEIEQMLYYKTNAWDSIYEILEDAYGELNQEDDEEDIEEDED